MGTSLVECISLEDMNEYEWTLPQVIQIFSFSLTNTWLPCWLGKAIVVLWAANHFVGSETPKHKAFEQFCKFKFHFKHFPWNTGFFCFDGPSNYLYLCKNVPEEWPSSNHKVNKMWFGTNIKYLLEPFFAYFCCQKGMSCYLIKKKNFHLFYKVIKNLKIRIKDWLV